MSKDTKNSNSKSDWEQDDEDDNDWDDWGDAEESNEIKITEEEASNKLYTKTNSTASNSLSESKETPTTTTTTQERNANKQNHADLHKEETEKLQKDSQAAETRSSWGLWGSKLTSVLSTATEGLGNITTTVSQGLNQVIGVPDPEDMARIHAAEMAKLKQQKTTTPSEATDSPVEECKTEHEDNSASSGGVPVFGLNLVSGVTTLGSKVLNTGLDTLEGIGKKTMDLLQENDPHLKNKRKLLGLETEKPNLSEILKEAKKDAETIENTLKELKLEKSKAALCFDVLFENYCGLVHLEALEILSKESKLKLQKLIDAVSGNALAELQETLDEVKELFELDDLEGESEGDYDADELTERFNTAIADLELPVRFDDIAIIWTQSLKWLEDEASTVDDYAAFGKGITSLAETCALSMSKLHKIAELLLVKDHHSTANEVDGIVQLCKQFTTHLSGLTTRFAATLTARQNDEAKSHVTTLFSELVLAMQQIEKAFNLFLPILQIGAV